MGGRYDLVIIGMGSGGMAAAEFAATLGIRVAVVERDRVGGDCLWTGCVPSKALLASAKAAHTMRVADRYGLVPVEPDIDASRVWTRMRDIQHEIAATDDDPDRFAELGVEVVRGPARLVAGEVVEVDGRRLHTRFVLLCTGSRPTVPPIEGLAEAGFLTSESLFEVERPPRSMVVIGGGPVAVEMAQALTRLGIAATVLQRAAGILPRDEPELVRTLTTSLLGEGVGLHLEVEVERVAAEGGRKIVHGTERGQPASWAAEEVLVAVGRTPTIDGLGLEEAGVRVGGKGIVVDDRMRTSLPSVYAAGDVAGRFLFTHSAGYEAVRAVRDMFFPGKGKVTDLVPWCTFTDPELAHVGMTSAEAVAAHGDAVEVHRIGLDRSDRARTESASTGAVVLVTAKRKLVGAHVLAPSAGEIIHELALAIREGMKLSDLAGLIHVYPTVSSSVAQLAAEAAYEGARRFRWLVRRSGRRP